MNISVGLESGIGTLKRDGLVFEVPIGDTNVVYTPEVS